MATNKKGLREYLRKVLVAYVTIAMVFTSIPYEAAQALEETFATGEDPQALAQASAETDTSNYTEEELAALEARRRLTSTMEGAPQEPPVQDETAETQALNEQAANLQDQLNQQAGSAESDQTADAQSTDAAQQSPSSAQQSSPVNLKIETNNPNIVVRYLFGSNTSAGWTLYTNGTLTITGSGVINEARPWGAYAKNIKSVYMDETVRTATMALWFEDCENLTMLSGTWNLEETKDLGGMFKGCTSLTGMNLSQWDVSGVEYFDGMFLGCTSLTALELSTWDTSSAKKMDAMFQKCPKLGLLVLGPKWKFVGETDLCDPPTTDGWGGLWQAVAGTDYNDPQGDSYSAYQLQKVWDGETMADAYVWETAAHREWREAKERVQTLEEMLALTASAQQELADYSEPTLVQELTNQFYEAAPEEEEQPQQEPSYPATALDATAGNTAVHVDAPEGALPEGTQLRVFDITTLPRYAQTIEEQTGEKVEQIQAIDVIFVDANDKQIEPQKPVTVTFQNTAIQSAEADLYHVDNDMGIEQVEPKTITDDVVAFEAADFSVYVVVVTVVQNDGETVISGEALVGNKLTASVQVKENQTGTVPEGITYKWSYADTENANSWTEITGITDNQLVLTDAYRGKYIMAEAQAPATSGEEGGEEQSDDTFTADPGKVGPIKQSIANESLTISGTAKIGDTLTVSMDSTEYDYQWYLGDGTIDGATSRTYTIPVKVASQDVAGKTIKVKVSAKDDSSYIGEVTSAATSAIAKRNDANLTTDPASEVKQGASISATVIQTANQQDATFAYEWYIGDTKQDETGSTFTIPTDAEGSVKVQVSSNAYEDMTSSPVTIKEVKTIPTDLKVVTSDGGELTSSSTPKVVHENGSELESGLNVTWRVGDSAEFTSTVPTLTEGATLYAQVTGSDPYEGELDSPLTATILKSLPSGLTVSGDMKVGGTATANVDSNPWSQTGLSFAWYVDYNSGTKEGTRLGTGATLTIPQEAFDKKLTVVATGNGTEYVSESIDATSAEKVGKGDALVLSELSGSVAVGSKLSVSINRPAQDKTADASHKATYTFKWTYGYGATSAADDQTITPEENVVTDDKVTSTITIPATAAEVKDGNSAKIFVTVESNFYESPAAGKVSGNVAKITLPVDLKENGTPTATKEYELKLNEDADDIDGKPTFAYEWKYGNTTISEADTNKVTLPLDAGGKSLTVTISDTKGLYTSKTLTVTDSVALPQLSDVLKAENVSFTPSIPRAGENVTVTIDNDGNAVFPEGYDTSQIAYEWKYSSTFQSDSPTALSEGEVTSNGLTSTKMLPAGIAAGTNYLAVTVTAGQYEGGVTFWFDKKGEAVAIAKPNLTITGEIQDADNKYATELTVGKGAKFVLNGTAPSGADLLYRWGYGTTDVADTSDFQQVRGATVDATLTTIPPAAAGNYLKVEISDDNGAYDSSVFVFNRMVKSTTLPVTVTFVNADGANALSSGKTATAIVHHTGTGVTPESVTKYAYTWTMLNASGNDDTTHDAALNASQAVIDPTETTEGSSTVTIPAGTASWKLKVTVTDANDLNKPLYTGYVATSDKIIPVISVTITPDNETLQANSTAKVTINNTTKPSNPTYAWYYLDKANDTNSKVSLNKATASITVPDTAVGKQLYVEVNGTGYDTGIAYTTATVGRATFSGNVSFTSDLEVDKAAMASVSSINTGIEKLNYLWGYIDEENDDAFVAITGTGAIGTATVSSNKATIELPSIPVAALNHKLSIQLTDANEWYQTKYATSPTTVQSSSIVVGTTPLAIKASDADGVASDDDPVPGGYVTADYEALSTLPRGDSVVYTWTYDTETEQDIAISGNRRTVKLPVGAALATQLKLVVSDSQGLYNAATATKAMTKTQIDLPIIMSLDGDDGTHVVAGGQSVTARVWLANGATKIDGTKASTLEDIGGVELVWTSESLDFTTNPSTTLNESGNIAESQTVLPSDAAGKEFTITVKPTNSSLYKEVLQTYTIQNELPVNIKIEPMENNDFVVGGSAKATVSIDSEWAREHATPVESQSGTTGDVSEEGGEGQEQETTEQELEDATLDYFASDGSTLTIQFAYYNEQTGARDNIGMAEDVDASAGNTVMNIPAAAGGAYIVATVSTTKTENGTEYAPKSEQTEDKVAREQMPAELELTGVNGDSAIIGSYSGHASSKENTATVVVTPIETENDQGQDEQVGQDSQDSESDLGNLTYTWTYTDADGNEQELELLRQDDFTSTVIVPEEALGSNLTVSVGNAEGYYEPVKTTVDVLYPMLVDEYVFLDASGNTISTATATEGISVYVRRAEVPSTWPQQLGTLSYIWTYVDNAGQTQRVDSDGSAVASIPAGVGNKRLYVTVIPSNEVYGAAVASIPVKKAPLPMTAAITSLAGADVIAAGGQAMATTTLIEGKQDPGALTYKFAYNADKDATTGWVPMDQGTNGTHSALIPSAGAGVVNNWVRVEIVDEAGYYLPIYAYNEIKKALPITLELRGYRTEAADNEMESTGADLVAGFYARAIPTSTEPSIDVDKINKHYGWSYADDDGNAIGTLTATSEDGSVIRIPSYVGGHNLVVYVTGDESEGYASVNTSAHVDKQVVPVNVEFEETLIQDNDVSAVAMLAGDETSKTSLAALGPLTYKWYYMVPGDSTAHNLQTFNRVADTLTDKVDMQVYLPLGAANGTVYVDISDATGVYDHKVVSQKLLNQIDEEPVASITDMATSDEFNYQASVSNVTASEDSYHYVWWMADDVEGTNKERVFPQGYAEGSEYDASTVNLPITSVNKHLAVQLIDKDTTNYEAPVYSGWTTNVVESKKLRVKVGVKAGTEEPTEDEWRDFDIYHNYEVKAKQTVTVHVKPEDEGALLGIDAVNPYIYTWYYATDDSFWREDAPMDKLVQFAQGTNPTVTVPDEASDNYLYVSVQDNHTSPYYLAVGSNDSNIPPSKVSARTFPIRNMSFVGTTTVGEKVNVYYYYNDGENRTTVGESSFIWGYTTDDNVEGSTVMEPGLVDWIEGETSDSIVIPDYVGGKRLVVGVSDSIDMYAEGNQRHHFNYAYLATSDNVGKVTLPLDDVTILGGTNVGTTATAVVTYENMTDGSKNPGSVTAYDYVWYFYEGNDTSKEKQVVGRTSANSLLVPTEALGDSTKFIANCYLYVDVYDENHWYEPVTAKTDNVVAVATLPISIADWTYNKVSSTNDSWNNGLEADSFGKARIQWNGTGAEPTKVEVNWYYSTDGNGEIGSNNVVAIPSDEATSSEFNLSTKDYPVVRVPSAAGGAFLIGIFSAEGYSDERLVYGPVVHATIPEDAFAILGYDGEWIEASASATIQTGKHARVVPHTENKPEDLVLGNLTYEWSFAGSKTAQNAKRSTVENQFDNDIIVPAASGGNYLYVLITDKSGVYQPRVIVAEKAVETIQKTSAAWATLTLSMGSNSANQLENTKTFDVGGTIIAKVTSSNGDDITGTTKIRWYDEADATNKPLSTKADTELILDGEYAGKILRAEAVGDVEGRETPLFVVFKVSNPLEGVTYGITGMTNGQDANGNLAPKLAETISAVRNDGKPEDESLSYEYRWYRNTERANDSGIVLDTGNRHVVTADDVGNYLYCVITAKNKTTNTEIGSIRTEPTYQVQSIPLPGSITLSLDTDEAGNVLPVRSKTRVTAVASNVPDSDALITYEWYRTSVYDSTDVSEATHIENAKSNIYVLRVADQGYYVFCRAYDGNGKYSGYLYTSETTPLVQQASLEGKVAITRSEETVRQGTILTATVSDVSDDVPVAYQWQYSDDGRTNWMNVAGQTSNRHTVQAVEVGKYIRVQVTDASNPQIYGSGIYNDTVIGPIGNRALTVSGGLITTSGSFTGTGGGSLSVANAANIQSANPGAQIAYQWYTSETDSGVGTALNNQTSPTLIINQTLLNENPGANYRNYYYVVARDARSAEDYPYTDTITSARRISTDNNALGYITVTGKPMYGGYVEAFLRDQPTLANGTLGTSNGNFYNNNLSTWTNNYEVGIEYQWYYAPTLTAEGKPCSPVYRTIENTEVHPYYNASNGYSGTDIITALNEYSGTDRGKLGYHSVRNQYVRGGSGWTYRNGKYSWTSYANWTTNRITYTGTPMFLRPYQGYKSFMYFPTKDQIGGYIYLVITGRRAADTGRGGWNAYYTGEAAETANYWWVNLDGDDGRYNNYYAGRVTLYRGHSGNYRRIISGTYESARTKVEGIGGQFLKNRNVYWTYDQTSHTLKINADGASGKGSQLINEPHVPGGVNTTTGDITGTITNTAPWKDYASAVERIIIDPSVGLVNIDGWFAGMTRLTTIGHDEGDMVRISDWSTTDCESMRFLFAGCTGITKFDSSPLTTVINGTTTPDKRHVGWQTSAKPQVLGMFAGCESLAYADLSGFQAGKQDQPMFNGKIQQKDADGSTWSTRYQNATLYTGTPNLKQVILPPNVTFVYSCLPLPSREGTYSGMWQHLGMTGTVAQPEGMILGVRDLVTNYGLPAGASYDAGTWVWGTKRGTPADVTLTINSDRPWVGATLTVTPNNLPDDYIPQYRWYRATQAASTGTAIGGITTNTSYTVQTSDRNCYIYCVMSDTRGQYRDTTRSTIAVDAQAYLDEDCKQIDTYNVAGSEYVYITGIGNVFDKNENAYWNWFPESGTIRANHYPDGDKTLPSNQTCPWTSYMKEIKNIDLHWIQPENMSGWFKGADKLTSVDLGLFDVTNCSNLSSLFENCARLATVTGKWIGSTSKVTTMASMFKGDVSLTSLDLSDTAVWDTTGCTSFASMFEGCTSLGILNIESWGVPSTGSIATHKDMFKNCNELWQMKLGSSWQFDNSESLPYVAAASTTKKASDYAGRWRAVGSGTTTSPSGKQFPWSADKSIGSTFLSTYNKTTANDMDTYVWQPKVSFTGSAILKDYYTVSPAVHDEKINKDNNNIGRAGSTISAEVLTLPDGLSVETDANTKLTYSWYVTMNPDSEQIGSTLKSSGTTNTYTIQESDMDMYVYARISDNSSQYTGYIKTDAVYIKGYGSRFKDTDGSLLNAWWILDRDNKRLYTQTSGATENIPKQTVIPWANYMSQIKYIELDSIRPENMSGWFAEASSLEEVHLGNFNTGITTDFSNLFKNCIKLKTVDMDKYEWDEVSATEKKAVKNGDFTAAAATTMSGMFDGCSNLRSIECGDWNTAAIKDTSYMFRNCTQLRYLDVSGWTTKNATSMAGMFSGDIDLGRPRPGNKDYEIYASGEGDENVIDESKLYGIKLGSGWKFVGTKADTTGLPLPNNTDYTAENGGNYTNYVGWRRLEGIDSEDLDSQQKRITSSSPLTTHYKDSYDGTYVWLRADKLTNYPPEADANEKTPKITVSGSGWVGSYLEAKVEGLPPEFANEAGTPNANETGYTINWYYGTAEQAQQFQDGIITLPSIGTGSTYAPKQQELDESRSIFAAVSGTKQPAEYLGSVASKEAVAITAIGNNYTDENWYWSLNRENGSFEMGYLDANSKVNINANGTYNWAAANSKVPWENYKEYIKSIKIVNNDFRLSQVKGWFKGCSALEQVDLSNWYLDNVTDMSYLFADCGQLEKVTFTTATKDRLKIAGTGLKMDYLFANDTKLSDLDLSNWEASVQSMQHMFDGCSNITKLDFSRFTNTGCTVATLTDAFKGLVVEETHRLCLWCDIWFHQVTFVTS